MNPTATAGKARTIRWVLVVLVLVLVVTSCAAGANSAVDVPSVDGEVAGFWLGLWHGIIAPITFVVSLFSDTVSVYEVHNTGGWYDFGFLLGAGVFLGGSGAGARSSRW
ncbi:MAG: hypothetical protein GY773_33540 [Actinomycetia bacterium]|nr:hypothetical protein [Actinomycetes bacterium]